VNLFAFGFIWIYPNAGGGGGGPSDPGTGWGGGTTPTDTDVALTVYAWEKDPSVTFTSIDQTILTDLRSYAQNTTGAEAFADAISDEIDTIQTAGGKAALRFWKEDTFDGDSPIDGEWYNEIDAYDPIPVGTSRSDFWQAFNDRLVSNGHTPDYIVHDLEKGIRYYQIDEQSDREAFFGPITVDDANNPYPNSPNPYIGKQIWRYGASGTNAFIQEWEQFAAEARTDFLDEISGDTPVAQVGGNDNRSNYNDYEQSFEIGDLRGNARLPSPQTRLSDITSPQTYLDWDTAESLTDPEDEYSSPRQLINRRRWKKMIWSLNKNASATNA